MSSWLAITAKPFNCKCFFKILKKFKVFILSKPLVGSSKNHILLFDNINLERETLLFSPDDKFSILIFKRFFKLKIFIAFSKFFLLDFF